LKIKKENKIILCIGLGSGFIGASLKNFFLGVGIMFIAVAIELIIEKHTDKLKK
jgi:hypothetical protein